MKNEYLDYVEDIIKAMDDASRFVKGMDYNAFEKERKTVYAAIRGVADWASSLYVVNSYLIVV
jgi:uncharacterized protein with HEPN domain